ncbi:MAG: TIGR02391 family protein [Pseudonocardiaceae bacterium]
MNTEWALKELDNFIEQTVMRNASGNGLITMHNVTAAPNDEVAKQAQVVEQILDRIIPGWSSRYNDTHNNRWTGHREAAIRAREALLRKQELDENLGENAPELSAAELHPWVWSGASSLWQSGHFREAVEGAIKKLNAETQNKVGRRDASETDLFKQAFTTDGPAAGKARLRRMEPDGSKTYESVQRGAMNLAEGIFAGIRNPLSHEADQELSQQEALEYLAALSVLARWVDTAAVARAEGES